jgi:transcriptional regulator with GAF, ATPase, and Fis domain
MRPQLVVRASLPPSSVPPKQGPGFHGAVTEFKRRLIEATLFQLGGNRTRTARALGLQRTYLLRLMREFGINVPRQETVARPNGEVPAAGGNGAPRRPPLPPRDR